MKREKTLEHDTAVVRERIRKMAQLVIDEGYTTRRLATLFRVSRTTAHRDITTRLEKVDIGLYNAVKDKLEYNRSVRHIRGGLATMKKYRGEEDGEQHNGL